MLKEQEQLQSTSLVLWKRIDLGYSVQCLGYRKKLNAKRYPLNAQDGQSILEVIVAMAIFSLIAVAMASMAVGGFVSLQQGGEQTEAEALAQEGIEAVRSLRDNAWNINTYSTSSVSVSGSAWVFDGEGTTETVGQYTRTLSFDNVCRDSSDDIADCPGSYTDVQSKKVISSVTWITRGDITNSVQRIAYLTNWDSIDWTQTDWSDGSGQSVWSDEQMYDEDDGNIVTSTVGQISLVSGDTLDDGFSLPTGTSYDWPFTTAGNYTYNSDDIQITRGVAELKQQGGSEESGDTTNPDFDTDSSGWTYNDWNQGGGEVNVIGARNSSGGNPSGWVDVNFPAGKNDELGGYWEQSFTTTADDPMGTLNFDWQVTQYEDTPDTFQLYVFIDSDSGAPTIGNEVWSSGEQTSIQSWTSVSDLDIASAISNENTYYLKIAVWLETDGGDNDGPYEVGYDNVDLRWEKTTGGSYPTDEPDIYPDDSYSVPSLQSWDSFVETATKNGGEIYYQLSNDNGSTWQWWNGSVWATVSGATDYNIVTDINTNIGSFGITGEQINFKAFLESDGSQLVQLDNINIGFSAPDPVWSFATWDVGAGEKTPTGTLNTSGGNPGNYVDVIVQEGNNDEVGGVWTQSFTTHKNSPSPVTVDFDYKVLDFNGTPDIAHVCVYIDTTSGDPVTQVGSSISVSGEGSWISASQIDASSAVPTAGIYYLKMVFYVETGVGGGSGPFSVGFDNVDLDLGNGKHPISGYLISSVYDMADNSPVQVVEWDETVPANTGLTLKVMTADGSGGPWTEGTAHNSDATASTTRKILSTDLNGRRWARYRVDLTTDGNDTPILKEVRVNYK